jgi:ribosome-associated translation inhibitor RaiA
MKKRIYKTREIIKVKKHLRNMIPYVEKIDISTDRDECGSYETMIRIPIAGKSDLFAFKRGASFYESLSKAHQAIIRQVHKIKTKKEKIKHVNTHFLQSA